MSLLDPSDSWQQNREMDYLGFFVGSSPHALIFGDGACHPLDNLLKLPDHVLAKLPPTLIQVLQRMGFAFGGMALCMHACWRVEGEHTRAPSPARGFGERRGSLLHHDAAPCTAVMCLHIRPSPRCGRWAPTSAC
jgi:hypothetical protein